MTLLRKDAPRKDPDEPGTCGTCGTAVLVASNLSAHVCQRGPDRAALLPAKWGQRPETLHGWWF